MVPQANPGLTDLKLADQHLFCGVANCFLT